MATQKKPTKTGGSTAKVKVSTSDESPPPAPKAPKQPQILNLEEAAEYMGISAHDLEISRYRGIEPGKLGFKQDGVLMWKRSDLKKAATKE